MLRNYINIAIRTLHRNLVYSFINITGLAIGIACSVLILLWVYDEVTYDQSFSKYHDLYQIKVNNTIDQGIVTRTNLPMLLKDILLQQDSRIKRYALTVPQSALLSVGEKKLEKTGIDASESFLTIFDYKMIAGNAETALNDPRSIVLTQSSARALFGHEDVLGKFVQVKIEKNEELKVTGIIADTPNNVSLKPDFILPFTYFEATSPWVRYARNNWNNNAFEYYVELQPGTEKEVVDASIKDIIKKNNPDAANRELFLHGISRWRLHNNFVNGKEAGGLITYVRLFTGIAIFILVIACINFMNLSTARSEHRAREVGIRKTVGSGRNELIFQFLGESILIAAIAFIVSIVLIELALPFYNDLVGKKLVVPYSSLRFWIFGIALTLLTGLLAGSYPAFYLSSFKPVKVLKGKMQAGKHASTPRQVMVTLQFCFSILLIVSTVVVYKQIQYLKNRELGYDQQNLIMLWTTRDIENNFRAIKQELLSTGAAQAMCKSNSPVTNIFASGPLDSWPGMSAGQHVEVTNIATEYDYTKTMSIRMLEGRDFSEEYKSDTAAMVLNKTAVKMLGLSSPVGEKIQMWKSWWHVIGVMDDVLMGSSSNKIDPLVMTMDSTWSSTITVRLPKKADVTTSLKNVEKVFKKYNPDYPFNYRFADAEFEHKFTRINMISNLAGSFSMLAIFITGLGLFGMAAFTAEQRTKEIGIRKVLGASVAGIVLMLTKDFSRLVLIAFIITTPIAWWAMMDFLQEYQIRIKTPLWVFPTAGIACLMITILIVSTQAFRAAVRNPVESLKSE